MFEDFDGQKITARQLAARILLDKLNDLKTQPITMGNQPDASHADIVQLHAWLEQFIQPLDEVLENIYKDKKRGTK